MLDWDPVQPMLVIGRRLAEQDIVGHHLIDIWLLVGSETYVAEQLHGLSCLIWTVPRGICCKESGSTDPATVPGSMISSSTSFHLKRGTS